MTKVMEVPKGLNSVGRISLRSLIVSLVLLSGSNVVSAGQSGEAAIPVPRPVQAEATDQSDRERSGSDAEKADTGMGPDGSTKLTDGQIQTVCLPQTAGLKQQLADPKNKLALVISSYHPGNGGGGILVHETGSAIGAVDPVASIGFFPNIGFGLEDTPKKYFLPKYLLRKSGMGADYCFDLTFDTVTDGSPKSEADVSLEVITPD
ncbi:hypothetical protein [Roseibium sp.]|uniref:hypothetical protein n=1 Tax=Roseibium sp. TaxID=1936156 RepID=UPI003B525B84